jgi:hemolysin-activating ACP:hemolysin acyltransferase
MHSTFVTGGAFEPHSPFRRRAEELGLACQLAARLSVHAQTPLGGFVSLVHMAQQVGQFKVYLNGYDECVAYVLWALLSPDVEREYVDCNPRPLAEWEFNEGTSPWILDLAVAPGSLPYVLADLRDSVFKGYEHVTYFRAKSGRLTCKRISREDRTSFMSHARRSGVVA